jgi:N-methylhydantoinase B/oxoprolinase/acetone carboxylase alpha subunit
VIETRYPVRIEGYRFADASAGPGKHGGEHGVQRIWQALAPLTVSIHTNRTRIPAWGVFGGEPRCNTTVLFQPAGTHDWKTAQELYGTIFPSKFSNIELNAGDRTLYRLPAGGGYGNRLDPDPPPVLQDYLDEFITVEDAVRVYGVMIRSEDKTVDLAATSRLRKEMRDAKL